MAGDSFGKLFCVHNWGESHGPGVGVMVEGCPPLLNLHASDIQKELDRRRPGQSHIVTPRKEKDSVTILSGVEDGKTTGAPIMLAIFNEDARSQDYNNLKDLFRPSHADFTYQTKYGIRSVAGGGRSSARILAGNVAAGAIAKLILTKAFNTEIIAYVKSIHHLNSNVLLTSLRLKDVEASIVRCPDKKASEQMITLIEQTKKQGDSLGGVIECLVRNAPAGLGEPVYDKLEADLAKACLAINACKGFEIGSGFNGTLLKGSEHNDTFVVKSGKVRTTTNHSGGIQGGISNGMEIIFRTAFKPTATILQPQETITKAKKKITYQAKGRHDPCVLPRAVPIVEAAAALVLCDHYLRHRALKS